MVFLQLQSLPAKKVRRDLEQELVQQLLDDRNNLLNDMGRRGLLGPNSNGETGVYRIAKKFGQEVMKRASKYFMEHRVLEEDKTEYEVFMDTVLQYICSVVIFPEFSHPPFNGWNHSLNTIKAELWRWVDAESDVLFPIYSSNIPARDLLATCRINSEKVNCMTFPELRVIVERDLLELEAALKAGSVKTVLVLSGSILEGLLLDRLMTRRMEAEALHAKSLQLEKWQLNDIIEISGKLGILPTETIAKFSHGLRSFRNLIHPGLELRDNLDIATEEAKIGIEVLNIVFRTLS